MGLPPRRLMRRSPETVRINTSQQPGFRKECRLLSRAEL
jgi:hypothetical protein